MKTNSYLLKNRDVVYLKELIEYTRKKGFGKNRHVISHSEIVNLLRVENVNGKLNVSLLPTTFTPEYGAVELTINPQSTIQLLAYNACSSFVVKQGKPGSELGMYLLDTTTNCKGLNTEDFREYTDTIAIANNYKPNAMDFMMKLYMDVNDENYPTANIPFTPECDPYDFLLLAHFKNLSEQRTKAITNRENIME